MKKLKASLLSMLALFLVGCGGTSESEAQPTEPPLSADTEKPTEKPGTNQNHTELDRAQRLYLGQCNIHPACSRRGLWSADESV